MSITQDTFNNNTKYTPITPRSKLAIMEKDHDYSSVFDNEHEIPRNVNTSKIENLNIIHHHYIVKITR